jgi:type IV pilus assembly protein PilE
MVAAQYRASGRSPQRSSVSRARERGVSLIELMVVVAIIAILASIAYPSYRQYVLQTNRTDAVRGLTLNAQILQRCYSQYFAFNNAACPVLAGASANGNYTLTETAVTANTYTLTATPVGAQTADTTCASFTVDQTGKQSALNSANADESLVCWGAS